VYETATRGVGVLVFPVAFTLACFAEELVFAWTGDIRLAVSVAPVVVGYSIGNAILAVAAFGYYLQFAHGVLRLHVTGMLLFLVMLTSMLIPLVERFGMAGAAAAWLLVNLAYLVAWIPIVHSRYLPRKSAAWFLRDVLPVAAAAGSIALLVAAMFDGPTTRLQGFSHAVVAGVASLLAAACAAFGPQAVTLLTQRSH
jgi:O-antigen/teichoic acid export membrane protein